MGCLNHRGSVSLSNCLGFLVIIQTILHLRRLESQQVVNLRENLEETVGVHAAVNYPRGVLGAVFVPERPPLQQQESISTRSQGSEG